MPGILVTANPILAPSAGDVQPSGVGFLLPCVVRDSSRLRSCSVAASRLGFYLVSPPSSRLGSGPRLVASSRVGLAGGSWWLAVTGWCLAVSLGGSGRLAGCLVATRCDSWGLLMARGGWLVKMGGVDLRWYGVALMKNVVNVAA